MNIPKIIHQIWSGIDEPLPSHFKAFGNTWQRDYSTWQYEVWDNNRMEKFIQTNYPEYWEVYIKFPFNVQRWDAIRYLILDKIGGLYVDYDYESIKPMDSIISNASCCFALEPWSHCFAFKKRMMFNNALMCSKPGHPFIKKVINAVFSPQILEYPTTSKNMCVLNTTGPWKLMNLYDQLSPEEKQNIYLIPAKFVTPLDGYQAVLVRMGDTGEDLENALQEAYAVHYFFSEWRKDNK